MKKNPPADFAKGDHFCIHEVASIVFGTFQNEHYSYSPVKVYSFPLPLKTIKYTLHESCFF